jgi:hypothetical protein
MQANDPPEDTNRLLRDHIESYEQLELLILLRTEPNHLWTLEALSARLAIPAPLVSLALDGLRSSGLVETQTRAGNKHHAYVVQSDRVEATVGRLIQAYRENPIPIIKQMSANAIERVRAGALSTFADAFILRKGKNDP